MSSYIDLILGFATVALKDSGKAADAAKLLAMGLEAWSIGAAAKAQLDAVNAELKAMQDSNHVPTRAEKDAHYAAILAAIDSVKAP